MGKLSKQKSLTGGKGWKLVKTVTSPMTHLRNIASAAAFKRANKAGGGPAEESKTYKFMKKYGKRKKY